MRRMAQVPPFPRDCANPNCEDGRILVTDASGDPQTTRQSNEDCEECGGTGYERYKCVECWDFVAWKDAQQLTEDEIVCLPCAARMKGDL